MNSKSTDTPRGAYASIFFTDADVQGIAEEYGIPIETARARAEDWAKAITGTVTELLDEQFHGAIVDGQP